MNGDGPTYPKTRRARLDGKAKRSVLVASRGSLHRLDEILTEIDPYRLANSIEVVVARAFEDSELPTLESRYPWARFVPVVGGSDYLALRRAAMNAADGDIVEILQDDEDRYRILVRDTGRL